jgi:hypothetical protein
MELMKPNHPQIGVGATEELSLRVSVAALVSVLFGHPEDGRTMLALERTATLREIEGRPAITVRAKPFGGAVLLTDPYALEDRIGRFHYDSEQSRQERDFRVQIHPTSWKRVKEVCRECLLETETRILDPSPERELAEEFEDTLKVRISPEKVLLKPRGFIVEDMPVETENIRAAGLPTVSIYYVYEAWIKDPEIIAMMLATSSRHSDKDLQEMAWKDARQGGKGRGNAILALGWDDLMEVYRSFPRDNRGERIRVGGYQLDGNVLAILAGIDNSKYQLYLSHS